MRKILSGMALAGLSALVLAGCSATVGGGAGAGGGGTGTGGGSATAQDVNGNGTISAGEAALFAYTPTLAADITQRVAPTPIIGGRNVGVIQSADVSGFGVGTDVAATGATKQDKFKTGTVRMSADGENLTVTVDGSSFTMPKTGETSVILDLVGGRSATVFSYGGGANAAQMLATRYSTMTVALQGGTFSREGTPSGANSYSIIAAGLQTPTSGMPAQLLNYFGIWGIVMPNTNAGSGGNFTAAGNFNTGTMTYQIEDNGGHEVGVGTARISGNVFSGDLVIADLVVNTDNDTSTRTFSGTTELVGTFHGPNAQEVAGVIGGNLSQRGTPETASGFVLATSEGTRAP